MQAFTGFYRFVVYRLRQVNAGANGCWCGNRCGMVSPDVCPSCGWVQANVANPSYPGRRACYLCGTA